MIYFFYDANAAQLSHASDRRAYVLFSLQYGELMQHDELSVLINDIINNEQRQGQLGGLLSQQGAALNALSKHD